MNYRGYSAEIGNDKQHGKISGIRDFVNFESSNADGLEKEFHAAVDDYIEFCAEVGKQPDIIK